MLEAAIHEESEAALNHLLVKHSDLKQKLAKSHAYAVFPAVGRAGLVLGGAYGQGEVYEHGRPVGFATLTQITVGVQVGGQTFTEVVIFENAQSFEDFKRRGKVGFSANASAVILKAAATGTSNPSGVQAMAFSRGGMQLEASLGGSSFLFVPPMSKSNGAEAATPAAEPEPGEPAQEASSDSEQPQSAGGDASDEPSAGGVLHRLGQMPLLSRLIPPRVQKAVDKATEQSSTPLRKAGEALAGASKEQTLNKTLNKDVQGALKAVVEKNPDFQKTLDRAYGYAVFPSVGRASLLLGASFGKGQVFEQNKLVGYAGLVQVTLGVQLGGETHTAIVVFADKEGLNRFKSGKTSFTANASAAILKAGAGATTNYQADKVYYFANGGLLIEAALGVQKCSFKPAVLTRGEKPSDDASG
jgi:lipid-binding SYLF domain-containing protein